MLNATAVGTFKGAWGKLRFSFSPNVLGDYRVVYTDYDNVAVIYSCRTTDYIFSKQELVWILTRSQEPSDDLINRTLEVIKKRLPGYDQTQFKRTKQGQSNNCKYLPNPAQE